jgi:formyl-CoA transferase
MLLADLGADVIKIEPPGTGDQTRGAMGFKMKGSDSMGFLNMNRNKRSVALNLKSKAGKQVFFELVKTADILVENYRPGVMKKLGIDYAVLKEINPGLVYASISGFGQTGPWAERPGFDLMAQAMSGVMQVFQLRILAARSLRSMPFWQRTLVRKIPAKGNLLTPLYLMLP